MKSIFINFQQLSVAKNCLRPEGVPLTILAIKRGILCNFAKTLKDHHFMGRGGMGLKYLAAIDLNIFKTFFGESFK